MKMTSSIVLDQSRAETLAAILKGIGHPLRLKIVTLLCEGEHNVTQLTEILGSKQRVTSQHLGVLRMLGLIKARREGGTATYYLEEKQLKKLIACLHDCKKHGGS